MRRYHLREDADHSVLLATVSFVVSVVVTRWWLQFTGYPKIGGGELHIAHILWGGLLLVLAGLFVLIVRGPWVRPIAAVGIGAGTGLFVDEIGKFITSTNDYFYPAAAPLIYGVVLAFVLIFVLVRRRHAGHDAAPEALVEIEHRWFPHRRFRRMLVGLFVLFGVGSVISFVLYVAVDPASLNDAIQAFTSGADGPVRHPTDPLWYWLEASVPAAAGALLLAAAVILGLGRERMGTSVALVGLSLSLTAGALLSLYVNQVSAITSVLLDAALLLGVLRFRERFLTEREEPVQEAVGI